MSPSGSSNGALAASPLRLNNIGQMLRKLQQDDDTTPMDEIHANTNAINHPNFEKNHFSTTTTIDEKNEINRKF